MDQQADQLAQASKRLNDLQWAHEWQPISDQIVKAQADRQNLVQQVDVAQKALTQVQKQLEQAQAQQQDLQAQAPAIKLTEQQLSKLADTKIQLQKLADLRVAYQQAQTTQKQLSETAAQALKTCQGLQTKLTDTQQALNELAKVDQTAQLSELETLTAGLSATARTWQQSRKRLADVQTQLTQARAQEDSVHAKAIAADVAYQQLHDQSLTNQIAALVGQLSANAPCPVCGSLDHPHPATVAAGQAVTPEALKQADAKRTAASSALAQAEADSARLNQQLLQLTRDVDDNAQMIQTQAGI